MNEQGKQQNFGVTNYDQPQQFLTATHESRVRLFALPEEIS